jgi:hypothetical protein
MKTFRDVFVRVLASNEGLISVKLVSSLLLIGYIYEIVYFHIQSKKHYFTEAVSDSHKHNRRN